MQRMDLGECVKVHDLALRADFEIASKEKEYFFELDVSATQRWCSFRPLPGQCIILQKSEFRNCLCGAFCSDRIFKMIFN